MAKYSNYIELDPKYESVVDLTSEERHPNLWRDYIVHDDMARAMECICESLKNEDRDKRRSFWIHGTYGTGKSYSALVLKHLFEDSIQNITPFLEKEKISLYKKKFIAIREKGEFLVVWRSGVTGITSETQLLMAVEISIREALKRKYGDNAYYGVSSLHDIIEKKLNDRTINWDIIFDESDELNETANSMDEIRERIKLETAAARAAIEAGQEYKAEQTLAIIAEILRKKGFALMTTTEQFEEWIKDVIKNNGKLKDGGIVFIWDEFTKYLSNGNSDALQRLSELCKSAPLFMAFIVHRDPSFIANIGEKTYEKIMHRYHELEFNISQDAAYELIGETIRIREGFHEIWKEIKARMLKSITPTDFVELSNSSANLLEQIRKVFPIHPMTLRLLTMVVQNFAASERTLFKFMKERSGKSGFPYYIDNNSEDDWAWLTPDSLWDYFFMNSSDLREAGSEAAKAYRHYQSIIEEGHLSDSTSNALHVFKAAMLLIGVLSTSKIDPVRKRNFDHRLQPTRNELYKCFQGQLTKNQVDDALRGLVDNKFLRLDEIRNGQDARLELPYTSVGTDLVSDRLITLKKELTRYRLFSKNNSFAKAVEEKLWDKNLATFNRVYIACAANDTKSIEARLSEIKSELTKSSYKIGILVVAITDSAEYQPLLEKLKNIAYGDTTGRLFVCALREALTENMLEEWYTAKTYEALAREDGKKESGDAKEREAEEKVQIWAASATSDVIAAYYRDKFYSAIQGRDQLRRIIENDVLFTIYPYAPERIVTVTTAFKPAREDAVNAAIDPLKAQSNQQIINIVNGLKACGVFNATTLSDIENATGTVGAEAISNIAKFINATLSDGSAKILLDDLWRSLQAPPFGLYNTLASAYLLGFIFKHYTNSAFHWYDGTQTTPLTEKDTAKMIHMLCCEKTSNHYLSAGTEAWRLFRAYVQGIFNLSDTESANEVEAKKHIRVKVIENGTPFWSLKYMNSDDFGGDEWKEKADIIIENISSFIQNDNTSDELMTDVTTAFTGKGRLKKILQDLYADKNACYTAFIGFIYSHNNELENLTATIGLNRNDFIDALKQAMSGSTWLWDETSVIDKLAVLELDFRIIDVLSSATEIHKKNINAIAAVLANKLSNLKVPGKVLESMDYDFTDALKSLHSIAIGRASSITKEEKIRYLKILTAGAKNAWLRLSAEKETIKDYVAKKGYTLTNDEIDRIFPNLKPKAYDYNEMAFDIEISGLLGQIEDARRKDDIKRVWHEKSGFDTITAWCNHHAVSVLWLVPSEVHDALRIIRDVQNKLQLSLDEVRRAHQYLMTADLSLLKNITEISNAFFRAVGEKYRNIFKTKREVVISHLRTEVTSDVYTWITRVGEIQKVIDKLMNEEGISLKDKIKHVVENSDSKELRSRILCLLRDHPELYGYFLEETQK